MGSLFGWCVAAVVSASLVAQPPERAKRVAARPHNPGLIGEIDAAERDLEVCRSARRGVEHIWVRSILTMREGQLQRRIDTLLGSARPFSMSGLPTPVERTSAEDRIARTETLLTSVRALLRTLEERNDPARRPSVEKLREQAAELERMLDQLRR